MIGDASTLVFVALTRAGADTARRVADALGRGSVHGRAGRVDNADQLFDDTATHVGHLFASGRTIVGVCAAGILIRTLAPDLGDKRTEPPVLALAEDGSAIVPLIGGHRGANRLAQEIGGVLGISAAITTAGDLALGLALDEPPPGYRLANPDRAKEFAQRAMSGEPVRLVGSAPWLEASRLVLADTAALEIAVTDTVCEPGAGRLVYHPSTLCVGIGMERGAEVDAVTALVRDTLAETGLAEDSVAVLASLDLKEDEPGLHGAAAELERSVRFFDAATLEAEKSRLANPSELVFNTVGCHGVAEGAALAAAGPEAVLIAPKRARDRVTCAIARAPGPIDPATAGRPRGRLSVIGIGPGAETWRTGEACDQLAGAHDIVGYSLYLDLVEPRPAAQARHDFALGEETARVDHALALAATGRRVALVSSGDPGIFAMAALVFERIENGPSEWARMAIDVVPGISAFQAAAARIGAPFGHDFCILSLSDLMTPATTIEHRLEAAAEGDFVVALYNPASLRRRTLLPLAKAIFSARRPAGTPVVLASHLGREREAIKVTTLAEFDPEEVDMMTLVVIGASTTRAVPRGDGGHWVYTPRGYGDKTANSARGTAA